MFQTSSKDDAFKRDQYKRFPSIQLILTSKDHYPGFTASSNKDKRSNVCRCFNFLILKGIWKKWVHWGAKSPILLILSLKLILNGTDKVFLRFINCQ